MTTMARPTSFDHANILRFFTGKNREKAALALSNIEASLAQGFWLKGVSRSVRASFSKPNVAQKVARKYHDAQSRVPYHIKGEDGHLVSNPANAASFQAYMVCAFGQIGADLNTSVIPQGLEPLFQTADDFLKATAPVAEAIEQLDATRPKPVFTYLDASPTITATLEAMDAVKAEVCPMEYKLIESVENNKKTYRWVCFLKWPTGTKFDTSRYSRHNSQCESCGHAIKNPFNWVPMVVTAKDSTPKAVWVGRDCAETFLGCKLSGDLEIEE